MKRLLVLCFLAISSLSSHGQAALFALIFGDKVATDNFNVSLEAGLATSVISGLDYDSERALAGQFGIGFNIKINEKFSVSPGANFVSTRAVFVNDAPVYQGENVQIVDELEDATLSLRYIDVPVKFTYIFSGSPWSLGIAPQISFNTGVNARYAFSNGEELTAEIDDAAEEIEFGSQFYVARSFNLSGKKIMIIGLRYFQGFTDALKSDFSLSDGTNRSNYIGLSLSFPFIADSSDN